MRSLWDCRSYDCHNFFQNSTKVETRRPVLGVG